MPQTFDDIFRADENDLTDSSEFQMVSVRRRRLRWSTVMLSFLGIGVILVMGMGQNGDPLRATGAAPTTEPVPTDAGTVLPASESPSPGAEVETDAAERIEHEVALGPAGLAQFTEGDGTLVLGRVQLNEGWETIVVTQEGSSLALFLQNGLGSALVAVIGVDQHEPNVLLDAVQGTGSDEPKPEEVLDEQQKPNSTTPPSARSNRGLQGDRSGQSQPSDGGQGPELPTVGRRSGEDRGSTVGEADGER